MAEDKQVQRAGAQHRRASLLRFCLTFVLFVPGPLFNFDVHDDVRLLSDATVEKDEVRSKP